MEKNFPRRKPIRLPCFDYSSPGGYFITICTKDQACILSEISSQPLNCHSSESTVGATIGRPYEPKLTSIGEAVQTAICQIPVIYPTISVEHFVIMPNHVHMLIHILPDQNGRPMVAPTIERVIQQFKGYVSKQVGTSIWQKLFFDHIIRDANDYQSKVKYIYENPLRWAYDELYREK